MTSLSLDEIHEALIEGITVWGGIPSVLLCPQSHGWDDFKLFIDRLLDKYGRERRFILGVSDMVTADADIDRLRYITDRVNEIA
jgi:hypothetical protein